MRGFFLLRNSLRVSLPQGFYSYICRNVILSRTHSSLWVVLLFLLATLVASAAFGQGMTRFELEEREQPVEDTTEVDWMNDTSGVDTIDLLAYGCIDMRICVLCLR